MKLVFISDVHSKFKNLVIPECDILIDSGDWTFTGQRHEVVNYAKWLNKQTQAKHIVLCPGNHERIFARVTEGNGQDPSSRTWITDHCPRAKLLIHESVEIEGLKIFGSPYTPAFGFNWAYNAGRTPVEAAHLRKPFIGDLWAQIPLDTQILITHGPGLGTLDRATDYQTGRTINVGCAELSKKILELKDLRYHSFGHLHRDGGQSIDIGGIKFINAAICDDDYKPVHLPVIVEL